MNPWEQYQAPDPRADPANWDPFGLYIGPTDYEPDYHGGTISTAYQPGPTIFQPGSSYTGSGNVAPPPPAERGALAPATSPDVRSAPPPLAPATAPATAPPVATIQQGAPSAPLLAVDQGNYPAAGGDAGTSPAGAGWSEPAFEGLSTPEAFSPHSGRPVWGPPATTPPRGNRWDDPLFGRYFATVGASQPERVALIRGLPGSVSSVRPQGFGRPRIGQAPPRRGFAVPATVPRTMPARVPRDSAS
jgi:hypothetical protein